MDTEKLTTPRGANGEPTKGVAQSHGGGEFLLGRPPENLPDLEPPPPTRLSRPSSVRIETLDFGKRSDRARFIDMAAPIYEGDPNYVAPLRVHLMRFLDPARNPVFGNLTVQPILAHHEGKIAGRMTVQIDRGYSADHEKLTGFFGFFECVNDRRVAHAMLGHAVDWLKAQGVEELFGPTNFTTNHQAGLLVENFDRPPFVEETYNPRYYEELFTSFGFGKAKDLLVWWIDTRPGMDSPNRARVARIAERVKQREGVRVRAIDVKNLEQEFDRIFDIYMEAWEKNWGFTKMSREEFHFLAQDIRTVAIPDLVLFVECEDRPVAFCATLPDINETLPRDGKLFPFGWTKLVRGLTKTKRARLYTLGTIPQYRKRGLETLMFMETVLRCKANGIDEGEIGWTLEDNDLVNRAIEIMDGRVDRKYRILGMRLGGNGH